MHTPALHPQVRQVELHPVQPWVVAATKSNHVCVWDWRSKQVGCKAGVVAPAGRARKD